MFRVLFLGDIVGKPGRRVLQQQAPALIDEVKADLVLANGENAAGGLGIDPGTAEEIFKVGVQIITTGNHVWGKKSVYPFLKQNKDRIIRPMNYPQPAAGNGWTVWTSEHGVKVGVVNLMGRVFTQQLVDCPLQTAENALSNELSPCSVSIVDIHAEATSEKLALAHFLKGRVSLIVGTHTHVQTADARILADHTAYISDVGMCGGDDGIIGFQSELIIDRFLSGVPAKFEVAKDSPMINGVVVCIDELTGAAASIERIYRHYD